MKFQIHFSKNEQYFLTAGIVSVCLYFMCGDHFNYIKFTYYCHQYQLRLKDIVLLGPALFVFSFFMFSKFPKTIFITPYNYLMTLQSGKFMTAAVLLFIVLSGMISIFVFEGIPHIQDSIAQYFQAKIFASGNLSIAPPEAGEFFDMQFIINDGVKWYGKYFFGQSLFMTIGVILNAPWIINPVLGGISLVFIYLFAKEMFDEKTSRLSLLLAFSSPFYFFMCSTYMSQVSSLFFIVLCLLCTLKTLKVKKWYFPFLAGVAFGLAFNTRPFPTLLITLPFFLYCIIACKKKVIGIREITLFCIPAILLLACFLLYNHYLTGDFFTTGYARYDPNSGLGFGPEKGEFSHFAAGGHTLRKAVYNTGKYFIILSSDLFGWPGLSLVFIFILLFSFTKNRWDYLLMGSTALVAFGYFFYWAAGICLGARYFFECVPMFLILTARGIITAPKLFAEYVSKKGIVKSTHLEGAVGLSVFLLCMINFLFYTPSRISLYQDSYWNVNAEIKRQAEQKGLKNALVFVESGTYRKPHRDPDYYNSAFILNSLDLKGQVVYARDLGMPENVRLMAQYPGREYYLFERQGRKKGILKKYQIKKTK